jgi:hypothetical protein
MKIAGELPKPAIYLIPRNLKRSRGCEGADGATRHKPVENRIEHAEARR